MVFFTVFNAFINNDTKLFIYVIPPNKTATLYLEHLNSLVYHIVLAKMNARTISFLPICIIRLATPMSLGTYLYFYTW